MAAENTNLLGATDKDLGIVGVKVGFFKAALENDDMFVCLLLQ